MSQRSFLLIILPLMFCAFQGYAADKPVTRDVPKPVQPFIETKNQVEMMNNLIGATQKNLEAQKMIREQVVAYQKLQDLYVRNSQDKELVFQMVKAAHRLLENIKENNLTQAFDQDFLSELTVFSQVATKRGVPKP